MLIAAFLTIAMAGTAPPTCDLPTIARRYDTWRGGDAFDRLRSVRIQGVLEAGGLSGTEEILADRAGNTRLDIALGPLIQHQVATAAFTWEVTPAGQVQSMALVDVLSARRSQAILMSHVLKGATGATATLVGCSTENGRDVADVRISFGDEDTYDALIVAQTGELSGVRIVEERQPRTETFDDWRFVDGVRMPFLRTTVGETASDAERLRVTSLQIDPAISPASFARPASRRLGIWKNGATSTGWIPFTYFAGNRIFLPARINGHAATVLLDSGATVSTADTGFAHRIGLQPVGAVSAPGTGGVATAGFVAGVDVEVGHLSLSPLTVATIDLTSVAKRIGHALPFVLGDEVFNETVVDIDAAHQRIAFRDPATLEVPKGAVMVPLHRLIGNRSVPVSVEDGAPMEFEFDLGNGSPLQVYPALYLHRDLVRDKKSSRLLAGGVGGDHPETVASLDTLTFAGATFHHVPTDFTRDVASASNSNRVVGNIGLPILSRFRLLIDYGHDRLFAIPDANATTAAFRRDRVGADLVRQGTSVVVDYVSPHSPAEAAGLKANDRVVSIDGRAASTWTNAALAALRHTLGEAAIRFTMIDGSDRRVSPADFY